MAESRPTHISVLLLTAVALCAAQTRYMVVRGGDEVTLSCESKPKAEQSCDRVAWLVYHSGITSVNLVRGGRVNRRWPGLSLTGKCSLVVKNVTEEDAGHYACRHVVPGRPFLDSLVILSVVSLTEHREERSDAVTFDCSVTTFRGCRHLVRWRLQGPREEDEDEDIEKTQSFCSASVTFRRRFKSKGYRLTCLVNDQNTNKMHEFLFKSAETSEETTKTPGLGVEPSTTELKPQETTKPEVTSSEGWSWWVIVLAVVLAVLLVIITVIAVVKLVKARQTPMDDKIVLTSNAAVTHPVAEIIQEMAESEYSISYSSISFTTRNQRKVQFPADGDRVTYSTVKTPSSSTADPSNRHAVDKPKK